MAALTGVLVSDGLLRRLAGYWTVSAAIFDAGTKSRVLTCAQHLWKLASMLSVEFGTTYKYL